MKLLFRNIDMLQVIGFLFSAVVTLFVWIVTGGKEPIASISLGFLLAALTQGFDIQKRLSDSEERLLKASILGQDLYRNEWLQMYIQQIVKDYLSVKGVWFDLFKLRADDAVTECRKVLHGMAEGYLIVQSGGTYSNEGYQIEGLAKAVAAIDDSYWHTPEAATYVQENAAAVRRGVRFSRVFT